MPATPELLLSQRTGDEINFEAARELSFAHLFRVALKEMDEYLDLVFARPGAKLLKGGYWYIIRRNPNAPPSFWEVSDDEGRACEPDERHLAEMRRIDSNRNPQLYAQYSARRAAKEEADRKEKDEMHRQFRERLNEELSHLHDVRIAVPRTLTQPTLGVAPHLHGGVLLSPPKKPVGGDTPTPPKES